MSTTTDPARVIAEGPDRGDKHDRAPLPFRQRMGRAESRYSPYVYIAPFFILFAIVGLFPLAYTFVVALNDWNLLTGPGEWVGLANFTRELTDPLFWN